MRERDAKPDSKSNSTCYGKRASRLSQQEDEDILSPPSTLGFALFPNYRAVNPAAPLGLDHGHGKPKHFRLNPICAPSLLMNGIHSSSQPASHGHPLHDRLRAWGRRRHSNNMDAFPPFTEVQCPLGKADMSYSHYLGIRRRNPEKGHLTKLGAGHCGPWVFPSLQPLLFSLMTCPIPSVGETLAWTPQRW